MYLSLQNRALVAAHLKANEKEAADKIQQEWHTCKSTVYPSISTGQRKISEELAQLDKLKNQG